MEGEENKTQASKSYLVKKAVKGFFDFVDSLTDICGYLSGILILVAIVIVNIEVGTRYVLSWPNEWGIPLAEYTLCYLALLPFAWILKHEGHVKVDFFTSRLNTKKRAALNKFISLVCMLLWAAMLTVSSILTWQSFWRGEYLSGEFGAPQWIMTLPVCVTSFLMACQFGRRWRSPAGEFISQ